MNPNPLTTPIADFAKDLAINTTSVYAAAQAAVAGFESLGKDVKKAFIFTGNVLNTTTIPVMLSMGVGKAGTAHLIESASVAYKDKGFRYVFKREERKGKMANDMVIGFIMRMRGKRMETLWGVRLVACMRPGFIISWQRRRSRSIGMLRLWSRSIVILVKRNVLFVGAS